MLTKNDVQFLLVELKQELMKEISGLFLTRFDAVMHELQSIREDRDALIYRNREHSDQLDNHEVRIKRLELTS